MRILLASSRGGASGRELCEHPCAMLMEWEFNEGPDSDGQFVATGKVVDALRRYLAKNEVDPAVTLYESCVQETVGKQLWDEFDGASISMKKAIANLFYRARDYQRAGAACEVLGEWVAAGRAYAAAYEWARAAECAAKAGDKKRAAEMYEKAGAHAKAAELHYEAGRYAEAAESMERGGDLMGAGQLFVRAKDDRRAASALAQVHANDPRFTQAVGILSEVLVRMGRKDLAAQRLAAALPRDQILKDKLTAELAYRLGRLAWEEGQGDRARQVLQLVVAFDRNFRDASKLLEAIGRGEGAAAVPTAPSTSAGVPSAPPTVSMRAIRGVPVATPTDPFAALDGNPFAPKAAAAAAMPIPAPATTVPVGYVQRMEGYDVLKNLPIFEELSLDEMKAFHQICEQVTYKKGEIIIEQGHAGEALVIVREGAMRVSKIEAGGKETVLATLPAGKYVGEMSLVDDAPTSARVTAAENVKALKISKDRFQQFLFANDRIALRVYRVFVKTLSERLRQQNLRA